MKTWQQKQNTLAAGMTIPNSDISEEPKSSWKGNLSKLPIVLKYNAFVYPMMVMEMVGWFLGGDKVVDHGGGCYLGLSLTDNLIKNLTNTLALLTQSYKTYLPQTNNQLRTSSNTRNQATIQDDKVVVQNVHGQQNKGQWNNARGTSVAGNEGAQDRVGTVNPGQENVVVLDEERLLFIAGGQDNDVYEDVDELPIMFMANISSTYLVYDEAGPSYDLDILSEVHEHDNYQDVVCELHEVQKMHENVQPNYIVDSDAEYTSDINMIPYDQYVKDNANPVVQNNVSS
nr:hypothetical protein [Tanacetum cinerariifolium]